MMINIWLTDMPTTDTIEYRNHFCPVGDFA